MLAVIGLPVVVPLAALLQLLFPGLLVEHWRQYRFAIQTTLAQSSLIFLRWALLRWFIATRPWWLSDVALSAGLAAIAAIGLLLSLRGRLKQTGPTAADQLPARIEYWALGLLAGIGVAWCGWDVAAGQSPWDQLTVVSFAALAGLLHLFYRRATASRASSDALAAGAEEMPARRKFVTTEIVFLTAQVVAGSILALDLQGGPRNLSAVEAAIDWPTFRGNMRRTGTLNADDKGPQQPSLLWTFEPHEASGRVLIHSSPAVVVGQVYVGAMHQTLGAVEGLVYCVAGGRAANQGGVQPGRLIWRFSAGNTLKPVFSSPSLAAGKLYFGEGYHQDSQCRLFCLDSRGADTALWSFTAESHVEASPTIADGRVYCGAGDGGLICVACNELSNGNSGSSAAASPKLIWQFPGLHIDAAPAIAEGRVFAGSVVGDRERELAIVAIDAAKGNQLWRIPTPLPVPGSLAYHAGRLICTLGNGKLNAEAEQPEGRVWTLDAATGDRRWEFRAAGSILNSAAVQNGRVYCCSRDHHCYALDESDGAIVWKQDVGEPIVAAPLATRRAVYVLTVSGVLRAFDSVTGRPLWRQDAMKTDDEDAVSSPVLSDGRLYVACGGKIYCWGDEPSP
jgi:outer membrane protein assembly factor BamB